MVRRQGRLQGWDASMSFLTVTGSSQWRASNNQRHNTIQEGYELQMVALTMMALALSEDSIRLRARRNEIINELGALPEHIREVSRSFPHAVSVGAAS
jgi:hypothetical protein